MIVSANPSSNIILLTVQEKNNPAELPAAVTTMAVPFVPNVPSRLKTVPMDVPDITPVTGVPPASLIPTVTFPTNPAPTDVHRPTPAVSVPLVRAIRIVT